jgi:hypothetical protein
MWSEIQSPEERGSEKNVCEVPALDIPGSNGNQSREI